MVSHLEDLMLRYGQNKHSYNIRGMIVGLLDTDKGKTLRGLRSVSRVLRDLVNHNQTRIFRIVYMNIPLASHADLLVLTPRTQFCQTLVVTFIDPKPVEVQLPEDPAAEEPTPPAPKKSALKTSVLKGKVKSFMNKHTGVASSKLASIPKVEILEGTDGASDGLEAEFDYGLLSCLLQHFIQLQIIQIRLPGYKSMDWPGRGQVEKNLLVFRQVLESSYAQPKFDGIPFSQLQKIDLSPIHFTGLMHLAWYGLSAFSTLPSTHFRISRAPILWQNIRTLSIEMFNPFTTYDLDEGSIKMMRRMIYTTLSSFTPTLKSLTFIWLPNPQSAFQTLLTGELSISPNLPAPSPLLLHLPLGPPHPANSYTLEALSARAAAHTQRPLVFEKLLMLKLGNIAPTQLFLTMPQLVTSTPQLQFMAILRENASDPATTGTGDIQPIVEKNGEWATWIGAGHDGCETGGGGKKGNEWVEIRTTPAPTLAQRLVAAGIKGHARRASEGSSVYSRDLRLADYGSSDEDTPSVAPNGRVFRVDHDGNTWI